MDDLLQQIDALRRHPSLNVSPDRHPLQNPTLVREIVDSVMMPYFLKMSPQDQEKRRAMVAAHLRALAAYCLHEYVANPEPRLTIAFIKGLHRQLYQNAASVPVKAVEGSMITMIPGEFKATPGFIRRYSHPDEWIGTTEPERVADEMADLLAQTHEPRQPLFQRYCCLMLDFTMIHPFPDSNGKLARLAGELFLLKQGVYPPCFALYEIDNKQEINELVERYTFDPQRDISIFYPVVVKRYQACLASTKAGTT